MAKYIKKPVAIEAVQFLGNADEISDIFTDINFKFTETGTPIIPTLEGDHYVGFEDWIIRGVHGEYYPCKPDIFKKTYYTEDEYAALG